MDKKKVLSAAERQAALDSISSEEYKKVKEHQASTAGAYPVDQEWLLLTEFALSFGWQAYLDVKNDAKDQNGNFKVTGAEMLTLIEAKRKLEALGTYRQSHASFIGAMSAQSKKPSQAFNTLTKDIIKQMKVKEL